MGDAAASSKRSVMSTVLPASGQVKGAGELRALIGIEDLGPAEARQRLVEGIDAERDIHGVLTAARPAPPRIGDVCGERWQQLPSSRVPRHPRSPNFHSSWMRLIGWWGSYRTKFQILPR
jgi:hypothetical protein